jgi:hypothetical protein
MAQRNRQKWRNTSILGNVSGWKKCMYLQTSCALVREII